MNINEYTNIRTALDSSGITLSPEIKNKIQQLDVEYKTGDDVVKERVCTDLKKYLNNILQKRISKGKTVRLSATTAKLQIIKDKFFPYYDANGNLVIPGGMINKFANKLLDALDSNSLENTILTVVIPLCFRIIKEILEHFGIKIPDVAIITFAQSIAKVFFKMVWHPGIGLIRKIINKPQIVKTQENNVISSEEVYHDEKVVLKH